MSDAPAPGRLSGLTVLVVEHETLLAIDYEVMLRREGCAVLGPVPREAAALALIEEHRPDAALLDLDLGGRHPVTLATELTARGVPVLVVSGYAARHTVDPVFQGLPRLDKPVNGTDLVEALAGIAAPSGRQA